MDAFERQLRLDLDRERVLALLSVTERRPVSPDILTAIEAAATYWKRGDRALANLRLIFADLPHLADPGDVHRLRLAETLLDTGFSPRALMKDLGLDPSALDLRKYDPDQPRVPAGNGRESGRWGDGTSGMGATFDRSNFIPAPERSNIVLVADQTTPGGFGYDKKIQKQMKSRNFSPEQVDEAVRSGDRIDAINKATGGPATRYVNPNTGQSVVIDNTTNDIIQVARPDFEFGPKGGDVPGATMRPAPGIPTVPATIVEEPVIIPDVILPP